MSKVLHTQSVRKSATPTRFVPPRPLRELKAMMVLKHLSIDDVARGARMNYLTACRILKGRLVDPDRLVKLRAFIERAHTPEATV